MQYADGENASVSFQADTAIHLTVILSKKNHTN